MTPEPFESHHQIAGLYEWQAGDNCIIFLVLEQITEANTGGELRVLVYACGPNFRVQPGQTTWWPLRVPKHGDTFKLISDVEPCTL